MRTGEKGFQVRRKRISKSRDIELFCSANNSRAKQTVEPFKRFFGGLSVFHFFPLKFCTQSRFKLEAENFPVVKIFFMRLEELEKGNSTEFSLC